MLFHGTLDKRREAISTLSKGARMEFRLLGRVGVHGEEGLISAGTAKESSILASLLLEAGRVVSAQSLAERVWDDEPPPSAKGSLQVYISRLRSTLKSAGDDIGLIKRCGASGYRLDTAPDTVDAHRFHALVSQARAATGAQQPRRAVALLREAEALWVGQPLEGASGQWAQATRAGLEEKRRAVKLARVELELQLGEGGPELLGELVELNSSDPFDQHTAGLLMRALDHFGRPGQALSVYRAVTARLRHVVGIEPRPELQRLHARILRGERDSWAAGAPAVVGAARTLDRDPPHWTGREDLVDRLTAEVREDLRTRSGIAVYGLDGMAGVGKTALAVHVAHRLTSQFPDGVLQVNLRAHDPRRPALDVPAALTTLLDAVGTDAGQIDRAGSLDALAALWRRQTAGRRLLVVLDDVAGFEDISTLVPAGPDSAVLLTSRRRLSDLSDGRQYTLEPLGHELALELLERISGRRAAAEAGAAAQVARRCGGLPLAVSVAAAYLRARPAWTLADLAARLAPPSRPAPEDQVVGPVDVAISLSYKDLSTAHRALLRRVAALPGEQFGLHAAAAALDTESGRADRELDVLVDHHLVEETERHRYRLHAVVRAYALGLAAADPEIPDALGRSIDFYIATAARAEYTLRPYRRAAQRAAGTRWNDPPFRDRDAADAWLTVEYPVLREIAADEDSRTPLESRVCLALILAKHLDRRGLWREAASLLERTHQAASSASARLSGAVRAELETDTAAAYIRTGNFEQALALARCALERFTRQGDARGQADTLMEIGRVHRHAARLSEAVQTLQESASCYARAGDERGRIGADLQRAVVLFQLGRTEDAVRLAGRSQSGAAALGDDALLGDALADLGEMHRLLADAPTALACFTRARDLARRVDDPHNLGILALNIGLVHRDAERWPEALDSFATARSVFQRIDDGYNEAITLLAVADLHRRRRRFDEAAEPMAAAEVLVRRLERTTLRLNALLARAQLLLDQNRPAEAADAARAALALAGTADYPAQARQAEQILALALAAVDPPVADSHNG
jgi:DNA-binding SARP family transcriptional activator/tetratricopeptide (TPR) repeat protein